MPKQTVTFRRTETVQVQLDVIQPLAAETLELWADVMLTGRTIGSPHYVELSRVTTPFAAVKVDPRGEISTAKRK